MRSGPGRRRVAAPVGDRPARALDHWRRGADVEGAEVRATETNIRPPRRQRGEAEAAAVIDLPLRPAARRLEAGERRLVEGIGVGKTGDSIGQPGRFPGADRRSVQPRALARESKAAVVSGPLTV